MRYNLFKAKLDEVNRHNSQTGQAWSQGINQFAASTDAEMAAMLGYKQTSAQKPVQTFEVESTESVSANPSEVNWVTANKVSAVKNQGSCGSCWAFSTTGAVESVNAIRYSTNVTTLSEQQLVDCSTQNSGCDGGLMDYAFAYIIKNGGIASDAQYPYTYVNGVTNPKSTCKTNVTKVATISKYTDVKVNNAQALEDAISIGSVSVAIDAGSSGFQNYRSGVFRGTCGTSLNHGVLAVGYGTDSATGLKYWLVKNSWGTSWGDKGYIKMERVAAAAGLCGIQMASSYPSL